jgi:hypothetical protein
MEPLLADVAADPELVGAIALPARAAECLAVLAFTSTAAATIFLLGSWAFLCRGTVFCLHLERWWLWLLHLRLR